MYGLGIDNDEDVVKHANELARDEFDKRVQCKYGTASNPENIKSALGKFDPQAVAITGITVWHEFLFEGEECLLKILNNYRTQFPGSTFIIVEYNGFSWYELYNVSQSTRESASVYQLLHPLTLQGMPISREKWLGLFQKGGIKVQDTLFASPNSTVYVTKL